jgi:hypothetical protein
VFAHTQQRDPGCNAEPSIAVSLSHRSDLDTASVGCRFLHDTANGRPSHGDQRTTEDGMTNEESTAHVRIRNWTLATGTKPGAQREHSLSIRQRLFAP